jgi:hypothetical protein
MIRLEVEGELVVAVALTNREISVPSRQTRVYAVSGSVFGVLRVATPFEIVISGVVVLRHCCDCRPPAFVCHVDKIGATDGVCGALAAVTGLPLLETEVCSQVANIAGEDVRGGRVDLGPLPEGALLIFKGIVHHVLYIVSIVESS